jgi:hypothetical protein
VKHALLEKAIETYSPGRRLNRELKKLEIWYTTTFVVPCMLTQWKDQSILSFFKDDHSSYRCLFNISKKFDTLACFKAFIGKLARKTGNTVKGSPRNDHPSHSIVEWGSRT